MCTVSFIPTAEQIFITSNRDESPHRQASGLTSSHGNDKIIIHYPLDEVSGGSWIALSETGRAVCLLNGAFDSFIPNPPYRQSRGLVVMDAVFAPDVSDFLQSYNLHQIAPFTLLVYEANNFQQLVWDGDKRHLSKLSIHEPQIWSSATLYPKHVRDLRQTLFIEWIGTQDSFDRESIMSFHQMVNGDPDNDFIMNRNDVVKTLSITSITLQKTNSSILHISLSHDGREENVIHYG